MISLQSTSSPRKRVTSTIATLAISLMAVGAASAVNAATLAAGPMYGGTSTTFAVCYAINTGSATVAFTAKTIRGQNGSNVALAADTCGSGLAPGASCYIDADISSSEAYSCELTTGSSAAALRGEFELRNSAESILNSTSLR